MKKKTPLEKLCQGLPTEFMIYLSYVKKLGFYETPDYKYLRALFRKLFLEKGFDFDYSYDWTHQNCRMSKTSLEEESKNAAQRLKKNSFGRPKMVNALNLKSKNAGGLEESKGAESEEEYATTAKLSKGVAIENQMRIANNLKRGEEISSSENTSKVLHVSGIRGARANEDELLPEEADINDLLSHKCEHLLIFQKMKSIEDCESLGHGAATDRRLRKSYRKASSLHAKSVPLKSNFGTFDCKDYVDDDVLNDWDGITVM